MEMRPGEGHGWGGCARRGWRGLKEDSGRRRRRAASSLPKHPEGAQSFLPLLKQGGSPPFEAEQAQLPFRGRGCGVPDGRSFLHLLWLSSSQEEFGYNAETQKLLCKNGETLLGAVNFFVSSINTLVNKTMEDTLMTVKQYETARWVLPRGRGSVRAGLPWPL